ncbi:MAG: pilus assembly protein [Acidobacteriia bacterium]|nr:pilus assembly protein [Terriglobia bacterium]
MAHTARETRLRWLNRTEASQIIEFALTLPLLLVFVVGIGDFGSAIVLKQKLNAAAREGARFAANEPTSDLTSLAPSPPSVDTVVKLIGTYLQAARLNDCGLASGTWTLNPKPGPVAWSYTGTNCPLTVIVDRGSPVEAPATSGRWLINSQVSISYPYQWQFYKVIGLIVSGPNYPSSSQITANAALPNLI